MRIFIPLKAALFVSVILALSITKDSYAQNKDAGLEEMFAIFSEEEIVVSALKRPRAVSKSPAIMSVITAKQIRQMGAKTLSEVLETVPGFIDANIIGIGPQSQLYTHVDTVELKPYTEIDWTSVYIGMFVPSFNSKEVAVKVGNVINNHSDIILFDTQIPHSAWNWTDEWWVSIRVAVKSKTMQ